MARPLDSLSEGGTIPSGVPEGESNARLLPESPSGSAVPRIPYNEGARFVA